MTAELAIETTSFKLRITFRKQMQITSEAKKARKVNLEGGTKSSKDGSTPEDLAYGCRYGLEGAPLAVPEARVMCLSLQKAILFTHFCVKGSIMVTYSDCLIFLA